MKKILIVTGGSGGHVIPALSIYDHLKEDFEIKNISGDGTFWWECPIFYEDSKLLIAGAQNQKTPEKSANLTDHLLKNTISK